MGVDLGHSLSLLEVIDTHRRVYLAFIIMSSIRIESNAALKESTKYL